MDLKNIKLALKTKPVRILLIFGVLYFVLLPIYSQIIFYDLDKQPEGLRTIFRDILWVVYWRYSLDWLIISGFILITLLHLAVLNKLQGKISPDKLSMYVLPVYILIANYLYMLAVDIAVTYFADVYIAGNWGSTDIIFLGMTAQTIYHGFFFWFGPLLITETFVLTTFLREKRCLPALKVFFLCMGLFSITLGLLDPVVRHHGTL